MLAAAALTPTKWLLRQRMTTISRPGAQWVVFGASVRGPTHVAEHTPNQDAWVGRLRRVYALVTVSDGLGSRPQSLTGARAVCWAAGQATAAWAATPQAPTESLIRMMRILWEMRVAPAAPGDCAATCLLALWLATGRLLVVGLGDGLALVRRSDGGVEALKRSPDEFSNRTLSLGQPHQLADWRVVEVDPAPPGTIVVLATDGVAEDLRVDRLSEWAHWLIETYGCQPAQERRRLLQRELRQWPTPGHGDDKTVAVLWRPDESHQGCLHSHD